MLAADVQDTVFLVDFRPEARNHSFILLSLIVLVSRVLRNRKLK